MTVTMRLEGSERLERALRELNEEAQEEVSNAIVATGLSLRGEVIKKYQRGPATGEVYEKYNPRRTHQASAPGEAPATDTGRLANSVVFDNLPQEPLAIEVRTDVQYGSWLEFGTRNIAPRPNWVPSIQEEEPKYKRRLEAALRRAAR